MEQQHDREDDQPNDRPDERQGDQPEAQQQPEYIVPDESWTDEHKEPPFPLNLESTHVCAILLILVVFANIEAQFLWCFRQGVWHLLGYVSFRASLTVAAAWGSTYLFEHILEAFEGPRNWVDGEIGSIMFKLVARAFRIELSENGTAPQEDELLRNISFKKRSWQIPRATWDLLTNGLIMVWGFLWLLIQKRIYLYLRRLFQYLVQCLVHLFGEIMNWPSWVSSLKVVINFVDQGKLWVDYTRDIDDLWTSAGLVGGQVVLQLAIGTAMFLMVFLRRCQSGEWKEIHRVPDGGERAQACNLRTTVVHLVSYTAYQIICFVVAAGGWQDIRRQTWRKWNQVLVLKGEYLEFSGGRSLEYVGWSLTLALLTFVVHLGLRCITRKLIKVCWKYWAPFIVWRTLWREGAIKQVGKVYLRQTAKDLSLDDRVWYRTLMTFFFTDVGPLPTGIPGGYNADEIWR
ncbi:hypothetical protein BJ170DRAFT_594603 [Xylariales sp. AK1849]|nr:hypothetical protein BJ170DRAFT_594603 [Xylariales sp. AK1849]